MVVYLVFLVTWGSYLSSLSLFTLLTPLSFPWAWETFCEFPSLLALAATTSFLHLFSFAILEWPLGTLSFCVGIVGWLAPLKVLTHCALAAPFSFLFLLSSYNRHSFSLGAQLTPLSSGLLSGDGYTILLSLLLLFNTSRYWAYSSSSISWMGNGFPSRSSMVLFSGQLLPWSEELDLPPYFTHVSTDMSFSLWVIGIDPLLPMLSLALAHARNDHCIFHGPLTFSLGGFLALLLPW